eukprot:12919778-Prorocentrum_lima.AAC.1
MNSDAYFGISLKDQVPIFQPIFSDGCVSDNTNNQVYGPVDGFQAGLLGHAIGILRAQLTAGHLDME